MWYRLALIGVVVAAAGGGAAADTQQRQPPPAGTAGSGTAENQGAIDPKADAVLHRMNDYLSGLKTFRVDTTTVDETTVSEGGQKIQKVAESKVTVRRPGEMRVDRVSPNGHAVFVDDGKQFGVYNSDKNIYATSPAPAKLERAVDQAREQLKADAPGLDLVGTEAYADLTEGATKGRYIGLVPMGGGVMAHQIAISKPDKDLQIWIQDGPQAVPLRYVVTQKDMAGHPQFTIQLRNWKPNAAVRANTFAFTPPAGAKQVAFAPPRKG